MKLAEGQIERIVREVLARLAVAPTPAAEGQPMAAEPATLALDQRLVTLNDLKGRLQNHRSVTVSTTAVVTPAVRDYLRERRVALVRREAARPTGARKTKMVVGVAERNYDASDLLHQASAQGVEVEPTADAELFAVVDRVIECVTPGDTLGVLLTSQTCAAVCLANRRPGVRAAVAGDEADVEAAIRQIGVNLLVIDPQGKSRFAIRQIIARFCTAAPHACPDNLKSRL